MVLGFGNRRAFKRGCSDVSGGIAAGRFPMVSRGGWDEAVSFVTFVQAVVRALSVIFGAGGDVGVTSAGPWGPRNRTSPGASAIDGLARAAPKRGDTGRQPGLSGNDCTVACGAGGASPESREADDEAGTAVVCGEPAGRCGRCPWRGCGSWPNTALEGSAVGAAAGPALGYGVEPKADFRATSARPSG